MKTMIAERIERFNEKVKDLGIEFKAKGYDDNQVIYFERSEKGFIKKNTYFKVIKALKEINGKYLTPDMVNIELHPLQQEEFIEPVLNELYPENATIAMDNYGEAMIETLSKQVPDLMKQIDELNNYICIYSEHIAKLMEFVPEDKKNEMINLLDNQLCQ